MIVQGVNLNLSTHRQVQAYNVISFEGIHIPFEHCNYQKLKKFPEHLYRTIGKDEYKKLIKGIPLDGHKYCSINPAGWNAYQWGRGFKKDKPDTFFVTFKKNHFASNDIIQLDHTYKEANSNWYDVRFVLQNPYSLDDVVSIRKGNNAHGEIVWANSPDTIANDKAMKKDKIRLLYNSFFNKKNESQLWDDLEEFSCFVEEYPEIIENLIKDKGPFSLNDIDLLIARSKNKNFLPYIRSRIEKHAQDKVEITDSTLKYIQNYGSNKDLDLILIAVKNQNNSYSALPYCLMIENFMEDKDVPKLLKLALESNIYVRNAIFYAFSTRFSKGEYKDEMLTLCRQVLKDYTNIRTWKDEYKKFHGEQMIYNSASILGHHGDKSDIELLKPYVGKLKIPGEDSIQDTIQYLKQQAKM